MMLKKKLSKIKIFFWSIFLIIFLFFLGIASLFIYHTKDLPRPEEFTEQQFFHLTRIYDRTGKVLLYELFGEHRRSVVDLEDVPSHLIQAIIVTEDSNFYHHFGIDFKAIIRASWANLRAGRIIQGASTITQQLSRIAFLTKERTIGRKIRELALTLDLEKRYTKDEILEFYLNHIPFGSNIYGVEAASQGFFNKSVSEVSIPEAAILAALIRAPSRLSPFGPNLEQLLNRKDYVLRRMVKKGYLSKEEVEKLENDEIKFTQVRHPIKAPHFITEVKNQLFLEYGEEFLRTAGFKIYTTIDWELQKLAEEIIKQRSKHLRVYRAHNTSLVAINPKTGEILAMVGSKNWFADSYPKNCFPGVNCLFEPFPNVALLSRQPGSAIKPFIYAAAFQKGYDDKEIVIDEETNFGIWGGQPYIPRNFDGRFRGEVTLRQSLAQSLNIPAIKVFLDLAGKKEAINLTKRLGITTNLPFVPSLVLGGGEVKLLDMVSAYGVFAAEGLRVEPFGILKIKDLRGNIVKENQNVPRKVLSTQVARLINDILSDDDARVPVYRPRSVLYIENHQVSVKTGTTDAFRDAWTVGYTPSIAVGVWVGNNDNSSMFNNAIGEVLAAPIWRQFIKETL